MTMRVFMLRRIAAHHQPGNMCVDLSVAIVRREATRHVPERLQPSSRLTLHVKFNECQKGLALRPAEAYMYASTSAGACTGRSASREVPVYDAMGLGIAGRPRMHRNRCRSGCARGFCAIEWRDRRDRTRWADRSGRGRVFRPGVEPCGGGWRSGDPAAARYAGWAGG